MAKAMPYTKTQIALHQNHPTPKTNYLKPTRPNTHPLAHLLRSRACARGRDGLRFRLRLAYRFHVGY
jgi:hypothetical protein